MPRVKAPGAARVHVRLVKKRYKRGELVGNILNYQGGMHSLLTIKLQEGKTKRHGRIY